MKDRQLSDAQRQAYFDNGSPPRREPLSAGNPVGVSPGASAWRHTQAGQAYCHPSKHSCGIV